MTVVALSFTPHLPAGHTPFYSLSHLVCPQFRPHVTVFHNPCALVSMSVICSFFQSLKDISRISFRPIAHLQYTCIKAEIYSFKLTSGGDLANFLGHLMESQPA